MGAGALSKSFFNRLEHNRGPALTADSPGVSSSAALSGVRDGNVCVKAHKEKVNGGEEHKTNGYQATKE